MRPEYKKLLKNTGLFAIGTFATSLLGLLMTPLYTSVLSTADYGIADLITVTTSLLLPLLTCAVYEGILRFSLDKDADYRTIYSMGISLVVGGTFLVALCLPLIAKTTIGPYKWFFLAYFACCSLHTITSYFVKGLEMIRTYTIGGIIGSVVVICSNLFFLLYLKIGVYGYITSLILGHIIPTLFFFLKEHLYRYISLPSKLDKNLTRQILVYSIPIIPNGISWWIANSSDKYFLNHFADVSQVGVYAVSYKIPTIMMTVMGFFVASWQLSSVEDFGTDKSKAFYASIYNRYVLISVLLASFLIVTAKPFASFLYAKSFFVAWRFVPILVIANVFNILASFMGTVYTGAKKTKMLSISTMIGAGSNITMNFFLIPLLGAMGAALATAASYSIMFIIRLMHSRRILIFDVNYKRDIFLFFLLMLQAYLVLVDQVWTIIVSLGISVAILFFNRSIFNEMITMILDKYKITKIFNKS